MREVEFKYKKWGTMRSIKRTLPTNYAEMTPAQFLATVRLSKGWIDEREFFLQFFGLTDKLLARMDAFQLYSLTETLGFLKQIKAACHNFYCEELSGKLLAPAEKLSGMSFQQFMTVDTYFSWFLVTEKEQYLDAFIAALYLKRNESYFKEEGLTVLDMTTRIPEVHSIHMDLKYSILVNWVLIKSWLSSAYPFLFPEGEASPNSKGDKVKGKSVDWLGLFDAWVGDNVASMEAYRRLSCMDAIRMLNRKIKEANK